MIKLRKSHIAVALLLIASVVSLLGVTVVTAPAPQPVRIKNTVPVEKSVWFNSAPGTSWIPKATDPAQIPIPVWWPKTSGLYGSWGRTNLHIVMVANDLESGEDTEVRVYARMYNADKSAHKNVEIYKFWLSYDWPDYNLVVKVPLKQFYFWVHGPSDTKISLSFYLSGS